MSLKAQIQGGKSARVARVSPDHALLVSTLPLRSSAVSDEILSSRRQLRTQLVTSAGSSDANVLGSLASPVKLTLQRDPTGVSVFYVYAIRFVIWGANFDVGAAGSLRRFGSATAPNTPLTNGILLTAKQGPIETDLVNGPIVQTSTFFELADDFVSLPNGIDTGVDFLSVDYDLPEPIAIPTASPDTITLTIQDDLTNLTRLRVSVVGVQDAS